MQIRSLRQLVLGSFVVALVPLVALLWQSQSDLASLSKMTASNTAFFVSTVSDMGSLESTSVDIERLIRQHYVYPSETLRSVTDDSLQRFSSTLLSFCQQVNNLPACGSLQQHITSLSNYPNTFDKERLDIQLESFRQAIISLKNELSTAVYSKVSEQENYLDEVQRKQAWSTAILVLLSLTLIMFSSQLILKPVSKLKSIIHAIATNQPHLPVRSSSGPKELLAVERDLFWLHNRILQLEKVRTALLRHASHELKTPLASFKEGCALLSEEILGPLNARQREVMDLLDLSSQRLNLLIEKLLDYNALLQQAEPSIERINSQDIIDECLTEHALVLKQNHREARVSIDQQERFIDVDRELFRRILDNLVSNAIAHGRNNTPIHVRLTGNHLSVLLEVANQGIPISLEDRAAIFEPFKRGERERNDRVIGAGLGLSIVSDCARLMGGDVSIVDVDYADVCFRVKLQKREAA